MTRCKSLVPRWIIAGLLLVVVGLNADSLLRRALIGSAERVTGARVEVAALRSHWATGAIELTDLQLADPRHPSRNLIQADEASLQFDLSALARRSWIIESGRLRNVQFATPRTTPGGLGPPRHAPPPPRWTSSALAEQGPTMANRLLDGIQLRRGASPPETWMLTAAAQSIRGDWERQLAGHAHRAAQLADAIQALQQQAGEPERNPLRQRHDRETWVHEIEDLRREGVGVQRDVDGLQDRLQRDVQALNEARDSDAARLHETNAELQIDGDLLSELLLGSRYDAAIQESLDWLSWCRQAIPDPRADLAAASPLGREVVRHSHPAPTFAVRELTLEGFALVAGRNFNFIGTLRHLALEPDRCPSPTTLELRAQGDTHVLLTAEFDRRGAVPSDAVRVQCPETAAAGQTLGGDGVICVDVTAGRVSSDAELRRAGDQLHGTLTLEHRGVQIGVRQLHPLAGGTSLLDELNRRLHRVDRFTTTIALHGTAGDLRAELRSSLGPQIARVMSEAADVAARDTLPSQLAQLDALYEAELRQLRERYARGRDEVARHLQRHEAALAELQRSLTERDAASGRNQIR